MKKGSLILLFICAISVSLVIGIFIGRNLRNEDVVLSSNTAETQPVQMEVQDFHLDINEATKVQLMELPGIGEIIADRILAYREENGPFQSTDELLKVEGIGEKKLQDIAELIKAGG